MAKISNSLYNQFTIEEYVVEQEPFYLPVRDEVELFEAAYAATQPVIEFASEEDHRRNRENGVQAPLAPSRQPGAGSLGNANDHGRGAQKNKIERGVDREQFQRH